MAKKKPTIKQRNLAKLTLENPTLQKGELVALGGYGQAVISNPSRALESKGYLEALDELGLTDELLTTSLIADIKAKPKNRVAELRLGAEMRGLNKRDIESEQKGIVVAVQVIVHEAHNPQNRANSETVAST